MRRLLQLLAGVGLLSTLVGCQCTTGVCDCEPHGCGDVRRCAGCGASAAPAATAVPQVLPSATALPREMPKVVDK
jgi:hypothetical protein